MDSTLKALVKQLQETQVFVEAAMKPQYSSGETAQRIRELNLMISETIKYLEDE